jgi:aryl-alcohol dehydrogenase-like predicted oxidoreductase
MGLGTLTWGRDTDQHEAADQLRDFVDAGGTLIDTAAAYGDGAAEELLGSLLGGVASAELLICTRSGISRRTAAAATPAPRCCPLDDC